ncbi:hypothetical protein [Neobacillus jeddahensis]|uniref:hypothetical protein n=1 Tax=Neobacillus jeddahensis TaxID=1461580 RepID=UPI00059137FD|nr:hypothetical protein [Neobacillus jeddahensis]
MKKGLIAGLGTLILLGGGVYGIHSVSAAGDQQVIEANGMGNHLGNRLDMLSQFKDQIHQVNQLREDRLDLRKQAIVKKDMLVDLLIAAKNSGSKENFKQAKEIKKQLKTLNEQLKPLLTEGKDERKALKEAMKKGEGSDQFTKLLATQQQVNAKLKEKLTELDKLIDLLK